MFNKDFNHKEKKIKYGRKGLMDFFFVDGVD
jgi:hypothetical protein